MCHSVPDAFHYMGVILSAGMSLRWLRDLLLSPASGRGSPATATPMTC